MYEKARVPREEAPYEYQVTYTPPRSTKFGFSSTEIKHLTISALLVMGVGLSLSFFNVSYGYTNPALLVVLALVFASVFLLHEIAHKLVAQHFGLWAEFRLFLIGALLTLFSVISPIKFVAPGAVMIAGSANEEIVGKTSVAGPLTNITLSLISLTVAFLLPAQSVQYFQIAMLSAAFNSWIALFNLLPIVMLDGLKVFKWSKIIWGMTFAMSILLTIFTFNYVFIL
jgi:Zn-dependent protease